MLERIPTFKFTNKAVKKSKIFPMKIGKISKKKKKRKA